MLLLLLVGTVLLSPLDLEVVLYRAPGFDDSLHRVSLFLFDLPALMLTAVSARGLVATAWQQRTDPVVLTIAVLVGWTALSAAAHPAPRAAQAVLRLVEAIGVGAAVHATARRSGRLLVLALAVPVLLETALAIAQVGRGAVVGLDFLGESGPLLPVGSGFMAKGTFPHPYLLAGWAMVATGALFAATTAARTARSRMLAAALLAVATVPLALTFSRMVVLGLVLALLPVCWLVWRNAAVRLPSCAVVAGFVLPAALTWAQWSQRAADTVPSGGTGVDAITTGRVTFARQGLELVGERPVLGVGPGGYAHALTDHLGTPLDAVVYPAHNVPLFIAAESGLVAGVAAVLLLALLALRAVRDLRAWFLFTGYLPFVLLDWPYGHPHGLLVLGAWTGGVLALGRGRVGPEIDAATA